MGDLSNRINKFVTKGIQFGVDKYQCPFCDQMHSKDQPEFQAHWPTDKEQQILMDRANKPPVAKAWDTERSCANPRCSWHQGYNKQSDKMAVGKLRACPQCGGGVSDKPLRLHPQMQNPALKEPMLTLSVKKSKIYFHPERGERPPKGVQAMRGKRGSYWYESTGRGGGAAQQQLPPEKQKKVQRAVKRMGGIYDTDIRKISKNCKANGADPYIVQGTLERINHGMNPTKAFAGASQDYNYHGSSLDVAIYRERAKSVLKHYYGVGINGKAVMAIHPFLPTQGEELRFQRESEKERGL